MKKNLVLIIGLFLSLSFSAQTENTSILKDVTLNEKTWINSYGFPIKSYDFSNQKVNELLNLGLTQQRKGKKLTTISYITAGAGAVLLFANGSNGGSTLAKISPIAMGGGLVINLLGMSKKKKAAKNIQDATYLYDSK